VQGSEKLRTVVISFRFGILASFARIAKTGESEEIGGGWWRGAKIKALHRSGSRREAATRASVSHLIKSGRTGERSCNIVYHYYFDIFFITTSEFFGPVLAV
jgi:hypothetical protein